MSTANVLSNNDVPVVEPEVPVADHARAIRVAKAIRDNFELDASRLVQARKIMADVASIRDILPSHLRSIGLVKVADELDKVAA